MTKPFDLVVHGATGFPGRLVVESLLQRYPAGSGLRWAMGGRNADKLAAVRDEVGAPADTPLVGTDTSNPASLDAPDDRRARSCGQGQRRAHRVLVWVRLDPV